ncbi:MAG: hypothetical protein RBT61_13485, partial [Candidatus Kapabacteria bacterium]|nr:hypothetical protein [Candidatus Kapabacteria bacterium]
MSSNLSYSQYLPVITNERGDTIHYTWPIPDSALCIKDEIIIRFKENALNLNKLCYNYQGPPSLGDPDFDHTNIFKSELMAEEFPIDTLITDPSLRETIKQYGGIYLKRITAANPCTDTVSITRYGDTVKCENYLWMKLKLNNDTSMINACINLTLLYQYLLRFAEPNYCKYFNRPDPIDNYYRGEIDAEHTHKYLVQKSL